MKKAIWISWEHQRRSVTLAPMLVDEYFEFNYDSPALLRYSRCLFHTSRVLLSNRGSVVIVQNPSMILAFYAVIMRPLLSFRLIIDRHTDDFILDEGKGFLFRAFKFMSRVTLQYADFTIVSNHELAFLVSKSGGKALILPDPYPQVNEYLGLAPPIPAGTFSIFCVASWSNDEPLDAYITAARELPDVKFTISGKPKGRHLCLLHSLPANVECTGYMSDLEYYRAMASSHGVIAFTSNKATLVCGGYEAIVLDKPFITGNSSVLRNYFEAAIFSDGSPADLVEKILLMQNNYSEQKKKVHKFHLNSAAKWENIFHEVKSQIFMPNKS